MRKIITGSVALKILYPDFKRIPKDLDYFTITKVKSQEPGIEYLENPVIFESGLYYPYLEDCDIITEIGLLTVKASHLFFHKDRFDKDMWDIQFLIDKGHNIDVKLYYNLIDQWKRILTKKIRRSNLQMSSEDFFSNNIKTEIDHDTMHELLIKHPYFKGQLEPTYKLVLKNDAQVDVDENKFNLLTFEQKCNLVVEEVMLMATERRPTAYYKAAYKWMLDKFIREHAPYWEALFIIQNYKLLLIPQFDFIIFLNKQINEHRNFKQSIK